MLLTHLLPRAAALSATFLFLIAVPPPVASQNQQYVSDQLEITLRSGPGTSYAIRKMLKSGTSLEVIEDNGEGYSKARTADGVTGWVLNRFLTGEPGAKEKLAKVEQRMQDMEQDNVLVQEKLGGLNQLEANLLQAQTENQELQTELERLDAVASDALRTIEENKILKRDLEESRARQQTLLEENIRLSDESTQNWFLIGAGVIILGMVIGLTIPNISWKKKRSSMSGINIDI